MRQLLAVLLLAASAAQGATALQPRDINSDGTVDAYYDADQNITWTADANLAGTMGLNPSMTTLGGLNIYEAHDFVAGLDIFGVAGWRLPKLLTTECRDDEGVITCQLKTSEMSLLGPQTPGPFLNVQDQLYWLDGSFTDTSAIDDLVAYSLVYGYRHTDQAGLPLYVWAVHDGDIAFDPQPVPEPSSWAMLTVGLIALRFASRRSARPS